MKRLLMIVLIGALALNVTTALISTTDSDDRAGPWGGGEEGVGADGGFEAVPRTGGTLASYTHSSTAVQYSGNTTSWVKRTIELDARIDVEVGETGTAADGLGFPVEVYSFEEDLYGSYKLRVEGSDRLKDLTFQGSIHRTLVKYIGLADGNIVKQSLRASLTVDDFPGIGRLQTSADGDVFPQRGSFASLELNEALLYRAGEGSSLEPGARGDPLEGLPPAGDTGTRHGDRGAGLEGAWVLSEGGDILGAPTMLLNITVDGDSPFEFQREVWLAEGMTLPVRQSSASSSSTENGGVTESVLLHGTRTMIEGSYVHGGAPLAPEGTTAPAAQKHPEGEFAPWDLVPRAGSRFDESSLVFPCDSAVEAALDECPGLDEFLAGGGEAFVTRAVFNATQSADPAGKAGTYLWNLTFSRPGGDGLGREMEVLVKHTVKRGVMGAGATSNTTVEWYGEPRLSGTEPRRDELEQRVLTLASSEELLRKHEVVDSAMDGELKGALDGLSYGLYYHGVPGIGGGDGTSPLAQDSFMDIELPTSSLLWYVHKEVDTSESVSACVDAGTGATLYVMTVETGVAALF